MVSQYQNVSNLAFIGAKGDRGGGDSCSYKTCKAPVRLSSPTNQHPVFLTGQMPFGRPTNTVRALKVKQHCYNYSVT